MTQLTPIDDDIRASGKPRGVEHVSKETVEASTGGARMREKLTGQQWAALSLAAGVFLLILITLIVDLWMLWTHLPGEPQAPAPLTTTNVDLYRVLTEHYTAMANAAQDRAMKIFETVVAASLLPLFTAIVGFIFGRERN